MIVYKKGVAVAEFDVGLGFNGLSDKLHSGDDATPEGRYRITKKNTASRFYKALLINYPNEEDRRRFAAAKQKREIPYWVGIGGLVEIHGGGEDSLTTGLRLRGRQGHGRAVRHGFRRDPGDDRRDSGQGKPHRQGPQGRMRNMTCP